jgi:predicted alpha/beta superfamily hydrolase
MMKRVKHYRIRGVDGAIQRVEFEGRLVDFWTPPKLPEHLLIAHDGQNVFDRETSTKRSTWRMIESAVRVGLELGITPPAIIGVFHSRTADNPWGRVLDLAPQDPFQNGIEPAEKNDQIARGDLQGNRYLDQITDEIAPTIAAEMGIDLLDTNKAVIGSSMGGLASLYALGKRPDFFTTALALSTHWSVGEVALVDALIDALPNPGAHKIWMSRGTRGLDRQYGPFQEHADQKMREAGWHEEEDFVTRVYKQSGHTEKSWAKYLDEPMKFWLRPLNR